MDLLECLQEYLNVALLWYVDDLFITTLPGGVQKQITTEEPLERLQKLGCYVSAKKA